MLGPVLLVTLSVLAIQLATGQSWPDPCTLMPNGPVFGKVTRAQANSSCDEGAIWWNYPQGTLEVEFRPLSPSPSFRVCLQPDLGPLLSNITDLSGPQPRPVYNPKELGESVCVPSQQQRVLLGLLQPPFLTYMTRYRYSIEN